VKTIFYEKLNLKICFLKGVELGPLEIEEKKLSKEIEDYLTKIMELEQKWLREQNELVRLVKDYQKKDTELKHCEKNFVVLTTKKMRIESKKKSKLVFNR